jgi:putative ABC transport system ATP-binding protein
MYKLSGVTKNYQKGRSIVAALRGVDLVIEDGEWLAVQGPTGHGKSTLLQILGGLDRPSSGVVDFDGRDLAQLRETQVTKVRAESIGFVFQTFNLIPTLSALENVETALVPLRVGAAARRQRATLALQSVGLGDRLSHVPGELSGGQQQRVAIARALVKEPKVLLADEPTGNLDEDTRDEIIGLLETTWRERGLTMVLVTHDSSIARRAQRIGVMKNGRLGFRKSRQPQAARSQPARSGAAGAQAAGVQAAGAQATGAQSAGAQSAGAQSAGAQSAGAQSAEAQSIRAGTATGAGPQLAPGGGAHAAPGQPSDLRAPDLDDLQPYDLPDLESSEPFDSSDIGDPDFETSDFEDPDLPDSDFEYPEHPGFTSSDPSPADTVSFD